MSIFCCHQRPFDGLMLIFKHRMSLEGYLFIFSIHRFYISYIHFFMFEEYFLRNSNGPFQLCDLVQSIQYHLNSFYGKL